MRTYYYLDYLHRDIFLEEEDIQAVPESGQADGEIYYYFTDDEMLLPEERLVTIVEGA